METIDIRFNIIKIGYIQKDNEWEILDEKYYSKSFVEIFIEKSAFFSTLQIAAKKCKDEI